MIEDVLRRVAELERKLSMVARLAEVKSVSGNKVRVSYGSGVESRLMGYVSTSSALSVDPTVGDQVLVICPDGEVENAVAIHGISTTDGDKGNKSKVARADLTDAEFARVWDTLAWTVVVQDGGGALHTAAATAAQQVQSVAANKVEVD